MKPAIFGTRIATLNCLHETLDQHSAFVCCCRSFKPMQRARRYGRERERKKECVCVCASERPRSTVLAISYFTYFCVGNMLLNMLKLLFTCLNAQPDHVRTSFFSNFDSVYFSVTFKKSKQKKVKQTTFGYKYDHLR